jgi:guanylate kinase
MGNILIGVVGPCAAGKTTLITALRERGFHTRHIAQEHSYVPDMWKRVSKPDILIFLDVSYQRTLTRRNLDWSQDEYIEQQKRLQHARQNANLYINTDGLTIDEVLNLTLDYLHGVAS